MDFLFRMSYRTSDLLIEVKSYRTLYASVFALEAVTVDEIRIICDAEWSCDYADFVFRADWVGRLHVTASGDEALMATSIDTSGILQLDKAEIECSASGWGSYVPLCSELL